MIHWPRTISSPCRVPSRGKVAPFSSATLISMPETASYVSRWRWLFQAIVPTALHALRPMCAKSLVSWLERLAISA
jgi:hypothetical protein